MPSGYSNLLALMAPSWVAVGADRSHARSHARVQYPPVTSDPLPLFLPLQTLGGIRMTQTTGFPPPTWESRTLLVAAGIGPGQVQLWPTCRE